MAMVVNDSGHVSMYSVGGGDESVSLQRTALCCNFHLDLPCSFSLSLRYLELMIQRSVNLEARLLLMFTKKHRFFSGRNPVW